MLSIFYPSHKISIPHDVSPIIFSYTWGHKISQIIILKGPLGQFKLETLLTNFSPRGNSTLIASKETGTNSACNGTTQKEFFFTTRIFLPEQSTRDTTHEKSLDYGTGTNASKHFFFDARRKQIKDICLQAHFFDSSNKMLVTEEKNRYGHKNPLWLCPRNDKFFSCVTNNWNNYDSFTKERGLHTHGNAGAAIQLELGFLYTWLQTAHRAQSKNKGTELEHRSIKNLQGNGSDNKNLFSSRIQEQKKIKSFLVGITQGFSQKLFLKGVGFSTKKVDLDTFMAWDLIKPTKVLMHTKDVRTQMQAYQNLSIFFLTKRNETKALDTKFKMRACPKTGKKNAGRKISVLTWLNLGFSHNILFAILEKNVNIQLRNVDQQPNTCSISINGILLSQVNQIAANIYQCKKFEPYKGKGFRYENQKIILKEPKKV